MRIDSILKKKEARFESHFRDFFFFACTFCSSFAESNTKRKIKMLLLMWQSSASEVEATQAAIRGDKVEEAAAKRRPTVVVVVVVVAVIFRPVSPVFTA